MFITLEGTEGSGKTSQIAPLAEFLRRQGYRVLAVREPGGTTIGDQIRSVLLKVENIEMRPRTEILLFQAARAQLVEQVIRPALAGGAVVLSDRYGDSTLAYQGYGSGGDLRTLRQLVNFATGNLRPDLTLLLDIDASAGLERRKSSGGVNRLDSNALAYYQRVRSGYLDLARAEPDRWVVVDAGQPFEAIQSQIRTVVSERLAHAAQAPAR